MGDNPAAELLQSRPTGSGILVPCSASVGGTCRQEFWVTVLQPISRGETTHTRAHTLTLPLLSRDPMGRQNQAADFEKKRVPRGPQEHRQAWGSHGSRASPGHPPSWPRPFLGLQPGRESFLPFRLLFFPVPRVCQNFWGPEPPLSPDEAKTHLRQQSHRLGRCTPKRPAWALLRLIPSHQLWGSKTAAQKV